VVCNPIIVCFYFEHLLRGQTKLL